MDTLGLAVESLFPVRKWYDDSYSASSAFRELMVRNVDLSVLAGLAFGAYEPSVGALTAFRCSFRCFAPVGS